MNCNFSNNSKHKNWPVKRSLKKKTTEHIQQPKQGLVTGSRLHIFHIVYKKDFENEMEVRLLEDY